MLELLGKIVDNADSVISYAYVMGNELITASPAEMISLINDTEVKQRNCKLTNSGTPCINEGETPYIYGITIDCYYVSGGQKYFVCSYKGKIKRLNYQDLLSELRRAKRGVFNAEINRDDEIVRSSGAAIEYVDIGNFLLGAELVSECLFALSLRRRRAYAELETSYLNATDVCNKIGIVRGLRNTGKTILMYQFAGRQEFVNHSAYVTLRYKKEADVASICKQIDVLYRRLGIKYFYIDEVTWAYVIRIILKSRILQ